LTAVVEVDVAVDVEPIVDLHVDHRSRFFDEAPETTRSLRTRSRSRSSRRLRSPFRSNALRQRRDLNVFARTFSAFQLDL
jgi:hypothetical protein